MKCMRYIFVAAVAALCLSFVSCPDADARRKSRKKDAAAQTDTVKKETTYDKLFKDRKSKTAEGLFKVHLLKDGTLIFELPKSLIGKDMLIGSSIMGTSDGGDGFAGYMSPEQMHVRFYATDSLVLLTKVSPRRFITDGDNVRKAVENNNIGAVIAKFPIETLSPDSTALVFKATGFFKEQHKEFEPLDVWSANSFGGLINKKLTYDSSTSMLTDVAAYPSSVAVTSLSSFTYSESFAGMAVESAPDARITATVRMLVMLLPEEKMAPRYADPRIGVRNASFTRYSGREQGSEEVDYAVRWDISRPEIVFYVDTLFPAEMADAITKGIEKWNGAFAAIGKDNFLKAVPYPGPDFDSEDPRNVCVKYEVTTNASVRSNTWTDPRTGEIIGATVYVPFDILPAIHSDMIAEIGAADPSVCTIEHGLPVVYEGFQAKITNAVGTCLGLEPNLAASTAVPVDSLRSPSYTSRYGLSGSVMDNVPANYIAQAGDRERGVKLVNTELGNYDRYVIRWLYGTIDGASTPDEEKPCLDSLIRESRKDPLCLYVRRQPYLRLDPRTFSLVRDLGDDPVYASRLQKENLRKVISGLDGWVHSDTDYTFRPQVNASIALAVMYGYINLCGYVGGIYFNETAEEDGIPAYQPVPKKMQKEVLAYLMEETDDMSWMDNTSAYRDIFFIKSPAAYVSMMLLPQIGGALASMDIAASVAGEDAYTSVDAYNDMLDYVLKYAKSGRKPTENNITMQYLLLGFTLAKSDVVIDHSAGARAFAGSDQGADVRMGAQASSSGYLRTMYGKSPQEALAALVGLSGGAAGMTAGYGYVEGCRTLMEMARMTGTEDIAMRMMSFEPITSLPFYVDKVESPQMYQALLEAKKVYQRAVRIAQDETARNHYRYFVMAIDRALKID